MLSYFAFNLFNLRHYITGIAHGIRALHTAKTVHRDVKGANVLVSDEGLAVLGRDPQQGLVG